MQSTTEIAARIHAWIGGQFPLARERAIDHSDSLLEGGIIDSMGVLEIVMYLEREFGVEVDDEDMVADHFESTAAIASFVGSKLTVQA